MLLKKNGENICPSQSWCQAKKVLDAAIFGQGKLKGGSITVPLTSGLTGLD
jgi:hypothetical protein